MQWAEGPYSNWFLAEVNNCWAAAAQQQWLDCGHVEGVDCQRDFYW